MDENNEFDNLRKQRDKNRIKGFVWGIGTCGIIIILISMWMYKRPDIDKGASFIMLWWGVALMIVSITTQITKNMK